MKFKFFTGSRQAARFATFKKCNSKTIKEFKEQRETIREIIIATEELQIKYDKSGRRDQVLCAANTQSFLAVMCQLTTEMIDEYEKKEEVKK